MTPPKFSVRHGDFLENPAEWHGADLILLSSTTWDERLLHKIALECLNLKKGTWVFSLTHKLPDVQPGQPFQTGDESDLEKLAFMQSVFEKSSTKPYFECAKSLHKKMSWGSATVHL